MILHTPLYDFCDGNLYGDNIVVIRKEFNEISFFTHKYSWKDIRKLIKNIKSGSAINLNDYIVSEDMNEDEIKEYENKFKEEIMNDLIRNGLPPKYMKDKLVFMWQGNKYETKISFLVSLFDLHKLNSVESLQAISFGYNVRTAITTIPVKDITGNIVTIDIQNRMSDLLLQNLKVEYEKYRSVLSHLLMFISQYKFKDEDSVRFFYKAIYGIDIYDENFKYQEYYLPRVKL